MACPLHEPAYLLSVIETIADSHYHPSSAGIHVLLDAYATFVNRVRFQSHILESCDALLPALAPLSLHKDNFVRALRRDIRLAHVDPFSTPSRPSLDESVFHINIKIDTKQYARDSSALCHHAICALTTIFRFPVFYLAFTDHDLSSLFGDVLDIALADKLPVLNEAKTYSLSLLALACHRLPLVAVAPRRDDLCSALQQSLNIVRQPSNIVLDGLKAISHTIERHPSPFLELLFPLLPYVIANLNCKSLEHRLHASIALGKFANALVHSELSLTKWQSLSNHITSFLESCGDGSQSDTRTTSFLSMVRAAFSAESHTRHTQAPAWILAVLASLIVLCGPTLFTKPTVLHFILQSLAVALTHKRSLVRALHPHVWRCFVWTFGQMLFSPENVEPALISSTFYVIKQEVSGGIGLALASVLLSYQKPATQSDERGDRVPRALSVIEAMVRTECKHTRREGFVFLHALINDTQVRHQTLQNICEIPASVLLDGAILRAEWDGLPSIIHSIPKVPISVHWPEKMEIAPHYKTLLVIWKHFASQEDRKHSDSGLVDVWLSILLVCSDQFDCGQHNAATAEMLRYMATIVVEFLPSVALGDSQPDWGSWNVHDQLYSLTFIDQLWSAMQRAFAAHSLAEVAELILTSILKYAFHVLDHDVQALWGRLCANLMITAPPWFLCDAHDPKISISPLVVRSQRELWGVVATSLSSSELSIDWRELVRFLTVPVCAWVLSEPELQAWETILRNTIAISGDSAVVIEHIVSQSLQAKEVEAWDSIIAILSFLLTCAHEHGTSPTDELLSTVDVCLTVCYTRACHPPEVLTHSLRLLMVVRQVIDSPPGNVMHILHALDSGICLWIEDHTEVMSDDQFNSVAVSLYCTALKALEALPLSIQFLQDMENFLASAFSRIPSPAIAPFAFEKFWRATYHGQIQFYSNLPPKIKFCLSCFVSAYGGDLADGLSLATESQSQSINDDSQVQLSTGHQHQYAGMEIALPKRLSMSAGQEDSSFLLPSPDEDVLQPTVLRQLQEYTSRSDASSPDGSKRSMRSGPRMLFFSPGDALPRSHSPEKVHSATSYAPNQKRKLAESDDIPQKRNRTSRDTLRTVRNLDSEPATRNVTPVDVPRMSSVPLKKRQVFDGVEVLTFQAIARRRAVQRAGTTKDIIHTGQDLVSIPPTPSSRRARTKRAMQSTLPSSIGSDEDDLDWEDFCIDGTSSEADIDRSLAHAQPSSPPGTQTSALHDPKDLPFASSPPKGKSQGESSRSLQRAETTSRLDALQDVYSSVANGASQIPWSELVQATRLVHQIGAVLTEQMSKKMKDPK